MVVEDADLEAIEQIDDSEIDRHHASSTLRKSDPAFFDRTYYLAPTWSAMQRLPFCSCARCRRRAKPRYRFVRQNIETCASSAQGDTLALETMFLAEDVNSQAEIEETVADSKVKEAERDLARQVIDSLAGEFDEADLIERVSTTCGRCSRRSSQARRSPPVEEPTETPVVRSMEALQSVAEVSGKQPGQRARAALKSGSRKRSGAKSA